VNTEGALCQVCSTTAVECQHIYRASREWHRRWCCVTCKINGPRAMHTIVNRPAPESSTLPLSFQILQGVSLHHKVIRITDPLTMHLYLRRNQARLHRRISLQERRR